MKKILNFGFYILLTGAFLALGLWMGPGVRTVYDKWFPAPTYVTGDYSALYKETNKSVVIFTTSTCPYCKRARELLAKHNIDYYDFITDKSPEAQKHYETLGESAVPVLLIADRKIVGAREDVIEAALQRLPH